MLCFFVLCIPTLSDMLYRRKGDHVCLVFYLYTRVMTHLVLPAYLLIMPPAAQIGRRGENFSTCPFVRLSVRLSVTKHVNMIVWKRINQTDFDTNWHKWSTGRWHETINFGRQEVKVQGHMRIKMDLEAWRRHHSRPLRSSRFSSSGLSDSFFFVSERLVKKIRYCSGLHLFTCLRVIY